MKAAIAVAGLVGVALTPGFSFGQAPADPTENLIRNLRRTEWDAYKVDPYIAVAVRLQTAGKEKAVETLRKAAEDGWPDYHVIILCRMLFTAKPKGEFRRPAIGGPCTLGGTNSKDWPLEPIELVDGVPFLVVTGYIVGGFPEPARDYLRHCIDTCTWNTEIFKPKTAAEKRTALAKLFASPKWKKPLTDEEKDFLADQIK